MITHARCKGVDDVDKFLNKAGLKPSEVQITYTATGFQSYYMVFFDDPTLQGKKPKGKKKTETEQPEQPEQA